MIGITMGNIFLLAQIWECPNDAAATSNNFGDGWGSQRIREQLVSVQKWRYLTNKTGNIQQTNKQTSKNWRFNQQNFGSGKGCAFQHEKCGYKQ